MPQRKCLQGKFSLLHADLPVVPKVLSKWAFTSTDFSCSAAVGDTTRTMLVILLYRFVYPMRRKSVSTAPETSSLCTYSLYKKPHLMLTAYAGDILPSGHQ